MYSAGMVIFLFVMAFMVLILGIILALIIGFSINKKSTPSEPITQWKFDHENH